MPSPGSEENVFWEVTGTAPNRELVVEWRDVPHFDCSSGTVKFQVVFFEGSSDVLFNYADVVFGGCIADWGGSATVGIAVAPDSGTSFSFNTQSLADNSSLLWTIAGGHTTTTVASSKSPSTFGESVTFTATVTGSAVTEGTVTFKDNGAAISGCSTLALNASGQATCTTSSLTVGAHTIAVEYSGSANFNPSSGTLTGGQVVNKANTTVAVASSQNPSSFGQSVAFTATVTGSAVTESAVTEGSTTFKDNGAAITGCSNVALNASGQARRKSSYMLSGGAYQDQASAAQIP